jgi:hypothetical protein
MSPKAFLTAVIHPVFIFSDLLKQGVIKLSLDKKINPQSF